MFVPLIRSPFCLFFFINFFTFSRGAPLRIKVPEVHHLKGYRSPLDEGIAPPDSDYFTSAENKPAGGGLEPDFPEEGMEGLLLPSTGGRQVPLCQHKCLSRFSEAVKTAMQSGNNFDRFKGVCRNYNETVDCMDKLEGERCSNQETFHVFTSGIRYMCIEQRKAFDAVIECMDAQSAEVEKECEEVCHVKERLAHWAVQSGIMDNFMQGALSSLANGETVAAKLFGRGEGIGTFMGLQHRQSGKRTMRTNSNGAKKSSTETAEKGIKDVAATKYRGEKLLDGIGMNKPQASPLSRRLTPDFLRAAVQDGCELMRCQLICYRVKFDAKCGGSAGALLSEAFVRPISQAQEFLTYGHIAPFMGAFLPHQCDFMVKKEVLNEFRIPPELDDALHRKYNLQKGVEETENEQFSVSKEKLPQEEDGPSVSPVAEIPNNNGAGNVDENVEQTLLNVSEADPGDRTKVSHVVGTARITKIN